MIRGALSVALLAVSLSGCVNQQGTYDGRVYPTQEQAVQAMAQDRALIIMQRSKLPVPITERRLMIAHPSYNYYISARTALQQQVTPLTTRQMMEANPLISGNYGLYDFVVQLMTQSGVFPTVSREIVEGPSNIQPSDDYDVLSIALAERPGTLDQWYYSSKRNGRQAIALDQGRPTNRERWDSYVDAIKAAAIQ